MVRIAPDEATTHEDTDRRGDPDAPVAAAPPAPRAVAIVIADDLDEIDSDDADRELFTGAPDDGLVVLAHRSAERTVQVCGVRLRSLVRISGVLWAFTTLAQVMGALAAWLAIEQLGWVSNAEGVAADLMNRGDVQIDFVTVAVVATVASTVVASIVLTGAWLATAISNVVGRFGGGPVLRIRTIPSGPVHPDHGDDRDERVERVDDRRFATDPSPDEETDAMRPPPEGPKGFGGEFVDTPANAPGAQRAPAEDDRPRATRAALPRAPH